MLDKGTLIEQGSHSELLALGGVYANLVRIQVGTNDQENNAEKEKVCLLKPSLRKLR